LLQKRNYVKYSANHNKFIPFQAPFIVNKHFL